MYEKGKLLMSKEWLEENIILLDKSWILCPSTHDKYYSQNYDHWKTFLIKTTKYLFVRNLDNGWAKEYYLMISLKDRLEISPIYNSNKFNKSDLILFYLYDGMNSVEMDRPVRVESQLKLIEDFIQNEELEEIRRI